MALKRVILQFALILAWVLGQQGALLHSVSHLPGNPPVQQEKHVPDSKACDKCITYAKLGGALQATPNVFEPVAFEAAPVSASTDFLSSALIPAFSARAPPALL